jgi:hypothetical protein
MRFSYACVASAPTGDQRLLDYLSDRRKLKQAFATRELDVQNTRKYIASPRETLIVGGEIRKCWMP